MILLINGLDASYFKYLINHLSIYPYTHWCAVCRMIISTPANQYIIYLFLMKYILH